MKNKYKVLIISSWIVLLVCLIIKLFGANMFYVAVSNEKFVSICNYIDNNKYLKFVILTIFNILISSIYYMALFKQRGIDIRWFIPLIIYAILKTIFSQYVQTLFFVLDFVMTIGLPIIIKPKIWLHAIIGTCLVFIFQLISMVLKLEHYKMFDENVLIYLILSIDYVIMMVLSWLYRLSFNSKKQNDAEMQNEYTNNLQKEAK